jgi:hypothetical protein
MKPGLFRDALLVIAPCAVVLAGFSAVSHHQRLVEAGYEVARLETERDALRSEVENRRVRVAHLSSPVRLMGECRARKLGLDYPLGWNRIVDDNEAGRLLYVRAEAKAAKERPKAPAAKGKGKAPAAKGKTVAKAKKGAR